MWSLATTTRPSPLPCVWPFSDPRRVSCATRQARSWVARQQRPSTPAALVCWNERRPTGTNRGGARVFGTAHPHRVAPRRSSAPPPGPRSKPRVAARRRRTCARSRSVRRHHHPHCRRLPPGTTVAAALRLASPLSANSIPAPRACEGGEVGPPLQSQPTHLVLVAQLQVAQQLERLWRRHGSTRTVSCQLRF